MGVLVALILTTSALSASAAASDWTMVKEYVRQPYPSLNEQTEHYFLTAYPEEQQMLEGGAFGGVFKTTTVQFYAWSTPGPNRVPVARFFGNTANGGPSSHFYTAYAEERDFVIKTWPDVWQLETPTAFYVALPSPEGLCMSGTKPIYRAYNQARDTNHFYSNKLMEREALTAKGWIKEGWGQNAVAFCVPAEASKVFVANYWAEKGITRTATELRGLSSIDLSRGNEITHITVPGGIIIAVTTSPVLKKAFAPELQSFLGNTIALDVETNTFERLPTFGYFTAIAKESYSEVLYMSRRADFNNKANALIAFDPVGKRTVWTLDFGDDKVWPTWVTAIPQKVYLLVRGVYAGDPGSILVVDSMKGVIIRSISIGEYPSSATYDERTKKLYVVAKNARTLYTLDTINDVIISQELTPAEYPFGVVVDTMTSRLYVTDMLPPGTDNWERHGFLFAKDLQTGNWVTPLQLGYQPTHIAIAPINGKNYLYIPNSGGNYFKNFGVIVPEDYGINVVDSSGWRVLARIPSESEPVGIASYIPE